MNLASAAVKCLVLCQVYYRSVLAGLPEDRQSTQKCSLKSALRQLQTRLVVSTVGYRNVSEFKEPCFTVHINQGAPTWSRALAVVGRGCGFALLTAYIN
jgi:hypothetical protein